MTDHHSPDTRSTTKPADLTDVPVHVPPHVPLPGHPDGELLQLVHRATTAASEASNLHEGGAAGGAQSAALVSIASSLAYIAESLSRSHLDDAQEEADRRAFCWDCREGHLICMNCGEDK